MVKVVWTKLALDDLKIIHTSISLDSTSYAGRFIDKLLNRVRQLENFPRSGRIVPEFGIENIRELIEGNYRIVYKLNNEGVFIVRVHHSSMMLSDI
ncbi:MAG: type II toxin-antitoxin system RelE/ParE family toxin [Saprospiraceae bacterium]|nr:type II toxin-antitoxin system RelE/ParE family toxin [Candidatus Vicinibacter affinis]